MEQALGNVVDNAVAVSPPGETVELAAEDRDGRLLLRVCDRGPGLDPDEAERIFEPFYTQRLHGTGLGLALSRRIVEGHGGTIAAFPRDGGGTEVRIELPRG
jgi:signal transduction histidine kinase